MPFTAAHPAIILPLLRHSRWFSATGLIAGSIAPDFEYFLLLPFFNEIGHTVEGLLFFNLPVALVVATIFHMLVRRPVVAHLPDWLQRRALAIPELRWPDHLRTKGLTFAVSVILGASSHILWDGFTHYSGYFVQKWPVLLETVSVLGEEVMYCRFIQHGSTIAGSLAILLYTMRLEAVPSAGGTGTLAKAAFWSGIGVTGLAFMAFALSVSPIPLSLMGIVVSLLTGCMLATITVSLSVHLGWLRQRS